MLKVTEFRARKNTGVISASYNALVVQSIFEILRAEVDQACEAYAKAKQNFWHISADVPTGLPHPEGRQRIENASRAQTVAMVAYTRALRRFNEFLLNGTVPEDLKNTREQAEKSTGLGVQ